MRPILLLLFFLFSASLSAQIILQMERFGTPKTKKFFEGQEFSYLLEGQKEWQFGTINRLILEENIVVFDKRYTELGKIASIRTYQNRGWSRAVAVSCYTFGASWLGFSGISALFPPEPPGIPDPFTWGDVNVALTSAAVGFIVQRIFRHNTYKLGKKRRLRIVDLNPRPF